MADSVNPIIEAFSSFTLGDDQLEQNENTDSETDEDTPPAPTEEPNMSNAGPTQGTVAGPNDKPPSVAKPQRFGGKKSEFRMFKSQAALYIYFNRRKFNNEAAQILWIISYLEGTAFQWVEPFLTNYTTTTAGAPDRLPDATTMFASVENFWKIMEEMFGDVEEEQNAIRAIRKLRQTTSASTYAAEFRPLAVKIHWGDQGLRDQYY